MHFIRRNRVNWWNTDIREGDNSIEQSMNNSCYNSFFNDLLHGAH
jgi:hypothetical protein